LAAKSASSQRAYNLICNMSYCSGYFPGTQQFELKIEVCGTPDMIKIELLYGIAMKF
jgi:hypothetical protein